MISSPHATDTVPMHATETDNEVEITPEMIDRAATELSLCGITDWDQRSLLWVAERILRAANGLPNNDL
jgi:hypothetical protein